jgi:hypothetical protein
MEGYVNLFENSDKTGNKPHFKGYLKIDGVDHEFALWPAKEGKKGFSGKYKVKAEKEAKPEEKSAPKATFDDSQEIPF